MEEKVGNLIIDGNHRVHLYPGSEVFRPFTEMPPGNVTPVDKREEEDIGTGEWEIITLRPDHHIKERMRVFQVYMRGETCADGPDNWREFIKINTRDEWAGVCFDLNGNYSKLINNKVCIALSTLEGRYDLLMFGDHCIGVYNTVVGAWMGPPYDKRISMHLSVVPAPGLVFDEPPINDIFAIMPKPFLLKHAHEVARIVGSVNC